MALFRPGGCSVIRIEIQMKNSEAATYLILKYGSLQKAYWAWTAMSYKEEAVFTMEQRQILREFEIARLTAANV